MKQLDLLSHDELILAADEISAMMTCRSELMSQIQGGSAQQPEQAQEESEETAE